MKNKEIKILLSAPRGFCAGVERAIEIVEKSILKYGAPVYVRHEIVHNKYVVDDLKNKGAVFVEELEEIEDKSRPVIFSAHGVPSTNIIYFNILIILLNLFTDNTTNFVWTNVYHCIIF